MIKIYQDNPCNPQSFRLGYNLTATNKGKYMTIAESIKSFHSISITNLMTEAEQRAVEINQDWQNDY